MDSVVAANKTKMFMQIELDTHSFGYKQRQMECIRQHQILCEKISKH